MAQLAKNPPVRKETPGSIPGSGRFTGEGKGYPLQYSGLENSMDYIVHGVTKSRTRLSDFNFHLQVMDMEALQRTRLLTFEQNCFHVTCTDPSPFALNSASKSKSELGLLPFYR